MEIANLARLPYTYEDQSKLDYALETMPLEQLYKDAEETSAADASGEYGFEDHLVKALLKWFKQWYKWVNAAPCDSCRSDQTSLAAVVSGTPEESSFGGSRVEVYKCSQCSKDTRFPRYNDPVKLLQTRRGRCGEWANVFTLLLRALGLSVRYMWNSEDHVWNEVWSEAQERWIHVDSCEEAFDKPLIYTDGWGKKMAYVVGFSTVGARDVTKRYVRRRDMQLERNRFPGDQLEVVIESINADCREKLEPEEQVLWYERDQLELAELSSYDEAIPTVSTEQPRQSGSADWVESRGEGGA